MRISDWSSDVCSSDLTHCQSLGAAPPVGDRGRARWAETDRGTQMTAPPTDKVLVETDGPVTIVTINRPHVRNAVDNETPAALTAAFRAFAADATARVAILTGAGGTLCRSEEHRLGN